MRDSTLKLQCWPGLARLWHRGELSAVIHAAGFSLALNSFLLTSFLWPGLANTPLRWTLGGVVIVWWLIGIRSNRSYLSQRVGVDSDSDEKLIEQFMIAQCHYLKGHWPESESILRQILRKNPRDVESGLLLSQVWRRGGQPEKALAQLSHLQKLDESLQWSTEISHEMQQIVAASAGDDPEGYADNADANPNELAAVSISEFSKTTEMSDVYANRDAAERRAA